MTVNDGRLATAKPSRLDLSTVLERTQSSLGKHHSLIVITASTKLDWLKTLVPLSKHGIMPTVILLDASTYGGKISAENVTTNLEQYGIKCHVIPRGMIELPKTPPQQNNSWKWHSTPTGEIVPIRL